MQDSIQRSSLTRKKVWACSDCRRITIYFWRFTFHIHPTTHAKEKSYSSSSTRAWLPARPLLPLSSFPFHSFYLVLFWNQFTLLHHHPSFLFKDLSEDSQNENFLQIFRIQPHIGILQGWHGRLKDFFRLYFIRITQ